MSRIVGMLVVLLFAASLPAWAQQDARIGTWNLSVAKSKYDPGPPPKSQTLKFDPSGSKGIKVTLEGMNAQGGAIRQVYTANYDGKDYPITGSANADTVSVRRIDPSTNVRLDKKGGNVVQMLRAVVSKDGKTFTVDSVGVNAQGQAFHNTAVYERQ